ncbi:phage tail protein [Leisingera thetidis]|uniref:phage tail protein n=1 Tax=Leisingera thetidis TaxID=2930199 RepID=UPI0021F76BC8|nr:phage tail protein [Leisingera thetidis]
MKMLAYAFLFLLALSQPAAADPVTATIAALGTAFKAAIASITIKSLTTFALRTLISTGVSLLMKKFKQRKQRRPGIQTSATTSGGTDPQGSVVGRYATAGHLVYQNSHGENRVYLTHVIELGDIPGANLRRLIIDGEYSDIGTEWDPNVGYQILSKATEEWGYGWIRFFDGSQLAADPRMVELYGDDPDRPWTANHILTGLNYAVLTFHRSDKMYPNGRPQVRFELDGPGFYDPRQDSTAGGAGLQRWDDQSTWQPTENLMVIAYTVMRGITLPCGSVWGGGFPAEDLPYAEWAAALDACDLGVGGNSRPQFRGGMEVRFEEPPADFLEEVFASANAEIVELGGYWYPLVGSADAYAADLTEDDLLVSEGWKQDPFPGLEKAYNAVTITHPSPNALWNPSAPITLTKPDWEAEDGGERVFDLKLPMVFNAQQARQLGNALLKENRRFRSHRLPLPPEYSSLRPLQKLRFTSEWYGYISKGFTITEMAFDLLKLNVSVSLREWDHSDFDPDPALEIPDATQVTTPIVTQDAGVPGFGVSGIEIKDAGGVVRGVGVRTVWNPSLASTADGISFQARVKDGDDDRFSASAADLELGSFRLEPMQSETEYEVRARALSRSRDTVWTAWLPVTTPEFLLRPDMLASEITDSIDAAQNAADAAADEAAAAQAGAAAAQAQIDAVREQLIPADFSQDGTYWTSEEDGAPGAHLLDARWTFADDPGEGRIARIADLQTAQEDRLYSRGVFAPRVGRTYRVTARVRVAGAVSAGTNFNITRRSLDAGYAKIDNAGSQFTATDTWADYSEEWLCTAGNVSAFWRAGIYRRSSAVGTGSFEVAYVRIEDATGESRLSGEIETIRTLDTSGLTGSALAGLITQLDVDAGGNSATITDHATAVADMDGFAAAHAGVTVETSGGKIAGFKATSWQNPDGTGGGTLELLGDVVAEGSMAASKFVSGFGRNLLENPDLSHGETAIAKTSSSTIGSGADFIVRGDGSYSDAYNRTIRLRTYAAATTSGYIGAEFRPPDGNAGALAPGYLVEPGRFYEFSAQLAVRRVRVAMRLYWLDSSGNGISNDDVLDNNWGMSLEGDGTDIGSWVRYGGIGQAPAGAKYVRPEIRIIGTDADGGSQNCDVHILRPMLAVAESADVPLSEYAPGGTTLMDGGRVVTDSLFAEAINTASFAAAGLAVFGNALKSSNFNGTIDGSGDITDEGSAGWAISKGGTMVLNNLVAREWVRVGAVSDGGDYSRSSTIGLDGGDVLTTLPLGAFNLGQFWQIACQVKFRSRSVSSVYNDGGKGDPFHAVTWTRTQVKLEWRTKNGSWSSWSDLHDFGTTGNNNSWTTANVVIPKHGDYDDVELRLKIYTNTDSYPSSDEGNSTWNNVDDTSLVARALVR